MGTNAAKNRSSWIDKLHAKFPERAAEIHKSEATERYWILRREVEHYLEKAAENVTIPKWRYKKKNDLVSIEAELADIEDHFLNIEENYLKQRNAGNQKNDGDQRNDKDSTHTRKEKDNAFCQFDVEDVFPRLLNYYKMLLLNKPRLSCNFQDLSLLLRDMNFIRTRLISDCIIPPEFLPSQLDFSRIEAKNLGLSNDPEIKTKLDQAAEELDVTGALVDGDDLKNEQIRRNNKARRIIVSLMATLNNLRIRKIYDQIYKRRKYKLLSSVLTAFAIILFIIMPPILNEEREATTLAQEADVRSETVMVVSLDTERSVLVAANEVGDNVLSSIFTGNTLVFIFFAGLAGGIFSLMMEFKPQNKLPGDEIYMSWYYITRPVIGAFGAMIMYIILVSPAFTEGFMAILSDDIVTDIIEKPVSSTGFAFAFLTGFTERIILPRLG